MPSKFAVSDIHGCNLAFGELLDKIAFSKADELYILGDYIDRGSDTKGVIQRILDMKSQGYTVNCLRGNHEQLLLDGFKDKNILRSWLENGGVQMLDSYNIASIHDIPAHHLDFIQNLDWYLTVDNYILVHAGLDWSVPDFPFDNKVKLLWTRHWHKNIDYDWLGDRYILHGHTPQTVDEIETQFLKFSKKRWLDIDAGCFIRAEDHPDFGFLCAFDMTNQEVIFHENKWY